MEALFTAIKEDDGIKLDAIVQEDRTIDLEKLHKITENGEQTAYTPLQYAAKLNRVDIAEYLLFAGVDVNKKGSKGRTALTYAVTNQHMEMVKYLLYEHADPNLTVNFGKSILWEPIRRGNLPMIKVLVEAGANVNASEFVRPLTEAIGFGREDIIRYLIEKGADINARGCISQNGNSRTFPPGCDFTPLIQTMVERNRNLVPLLLESGANVNTSMDGVSPLCYAVRVSPPDIVRLLLERGADVNFQTDTVKMTALMYAVTRKPISYEILQLLCEFGANKLLQNRQGKTAIDFAESLPDEDIMNDVINILSTCGITDPSVRRSNSVGQNQNTSDPTFEIAPNGDPQGGRRKKTRRSKHRRSTRRRSNNRS